MSEDSPDPTASNPLASMTLDRREAMQLVGTSLFLAGLPACVQGQPSSPTRPNLVAVDAGTPDTGGEADAGPSDDAGSPGCDPSMSVCLDISDPTNSVLAQVDGSGVLDVGFDRLIIVRTSETEFNVTSAVCTHQGCSVEYQAAGPDLACPCHGADFAMDGSVLRGPARRPLTHYDTAFDGTTLTIFK